MDKQFAEESEKTKRARSKLLKKLEAIETAVTPQALKEKTIEIHRRIARHAASRIVLRTKAISLFDENKNPAATSQRVDRVASGLKKEFQISS